MATFTGGNNITIISPDLIRAAGCGDPQYEKLISVIQQRFPRTCNLIAPEIHEYWELCKVHSIKDGTQQEKSSLPYQIDNIELGLMD